MAPRGPGGLTRREFLIATVAAATVSACSDDDGGAGEGAQGRDGTTPSSAARTTPTFASNPFTLGVASGDPLHDRIVLWTMLRPEGGELPDGDVEVEWEIALDPELTDVVASGTATAVAGLGHSVHVDAAGLDPDTVHHFRFRVGEWETEPARTRTFAPTGTMPERFRFAFSSCQRWEDGNYAAYRDVAASDALDAFVFLGDYIYENGERNDTSGQPRTLGQDFECETLDQYRQRYALYRSDPLLRAAHARLPWIVTWDDHEVDNDYAGAISERDAPEAEFLRRRAAAYQAWYEFMPVRLDPPSGPDLDIYRSFAHGDLVRFHVLDTRQYRSDQQRGPAFVEQLGEDVQVRIDGEQGRTMLGDAQREWLLAGAESSTATWDVLAQQVFMFGGNAIAGAEPPIIVVDTWDGYADERRVVLDALGASVDNLVVLTGDFHAAVVADLRADPFDQSLPVIGSELMATSIASSFYEDDEAVEGLVSAALEANPQIKWFDANRGYTSCEVTPERWLVTHRVVDDPTDPGSPVSTASTWEIVAGSPGPRQVS